MAKEIITLTNEKGGVGKTTAAVNLADALFRRGQRVLLVDMDGQGNMTTHLSKEPGLDSLTFMRYVGDDVEGEKIPIEKTSLGDLIVSTPDLDVLDQVLAGEAGTRKYKFLSRAISSLAKNYDYVIIDPPAKRGIALENTLIAATLALVAVEPQTYSLDGIRKFALTLSGIKDDNPKLKVAVLATKCRGFITEKNVLSDLDEEAVRLFGRGLLSSGIRFSSAFTDAADYLVPLSGLRGSFARKAVGAISDFESLADEIEKGVK